MSTNIQQPQRNRDEGRHSHQATQLQEPIQPTVSLKAAFIRLIPPDHASFMGMIVQVACIVVGIIDYAHTQSLDRFLLMCGLGTGGSTGIRHVARQLPSPREGKPHNKLSNTGGLTL